LHPFPDKKGLFVHGHPLQSPQDIASGWPFLFEVTIVSRRDGKRNYKTHIFNMFQVFLCGEITGGGRQKPQHREAHRPDGTHPTRNPPVRASHRKSTGLALLPVHMISSVNLPKINGLQDN
jgi:hypothetical protein